MSATAATARQLLERTGEHPVVSVFFDLDPERFATPPARATQLRSLLDEGRRHAGDHDRLDHGERVAVEADLDRIEALLGGDDAPVEGARALAVFASQGDGLFETVRLAHSVPGRVVIARRPYIEPLIIGSGGENWCVTLVSRKVGRIFAGPAEALRERTHRTDDVHGQHSQGGWSQARYERSYEAETDAHLREVAEEVHRLWQHDHFHRLLLGGPEEIVARFVGELHGDVRPLVDEQRVSVTVDTATPQDIRVTAARLLQAGEQAGSPVVAQLEQRLGQDAAVIGVNEVLDALNQRRVERLVIERNLTLDGRRCPLDGLLYSAETDVCPSDGNPTEAVEDLREAIVEAAVLQDAHVTVAGEGSEVPPPVLVRGGGLGAFLRF